MSTFHVRAGGVSGATGTYQDALHSVAAALAVARKTPGGDTIHVWGVYTPRGVQIDEDGTRLIGHGGAKISAPTKAGHALLIRADNVRVEGFEVEGGRAGIAAAKGSDFITLIDNNVHGAAGNGISLIGGSGYLVQGNHVWGNYGPKDVHSSGISILFPADIKGYAPAYAIRVVGNTVEDNGNGTPTDGGGLILDCFRARNPLGAFEGATLIADNTFEGNGGAGVYAYHVANVAIRGNTFLGNGTDPLKPRSVELAINDAQDVRIFNNKFRPNLDVVSDAGNDRFAFASLGDKNTAAFGHNDWGDPDHVVAPWSKPLHSASGPSPMHFLDVDHDYVGVSSHEIDWSL